MPSWLQVYRLSPQFIFTPLTTHTSIGYMAGFRRSSELHGGGGGAVPCRRQATEWILDDESLPDVNLLFDNRSGSMPCTVPLSKDWIASCADL